MRLTKVSAGSILSNGAQQPLSFSLRVSLIGPLWSPGIFRKVLDAAAKDTTAYGKNLIASDTPVDTGNLRSKWFTTEKTIENETYYVFFVEYGTIFFDGYFMATKNTAKIQRYYIQRIQHHINAKVKAGIRYIERLI